MQPDYAPWAPTNQRLDALGFCFVLTPHLDVLSGGLAADETWQLDNEGIPL